MKKFFYLSIAALALVSCSSDDFLGDTPVEESGALNSEEAIAFGGSTLRPTRAQQFTGSEAADKLHNNFVVYGFKTSAEEAADASVDQKVFGLYNVNYNPGTANTTESNTTNWEYVGYTSLEDQLQTIKYWDLSAQSYVFSAVSGTGITAEKITEGDTKYDKGWKVTVPAGGSISDLYASDRVVATKEGTGDGVTGKYKETVTLTFRALGTKIRFAVYETVPGYSVHIDKVFYDNEGTQTVDKTNFAIQGNFRMANATTETPLTITYYDAESGIENRPKVDYEEGNVTTSKFGVFGANMQATEAIGTNSAEATYDQSDKSYTMILPYEDTENVMKLKVTYTLTATDGSGEKITVHAATAYVPANFNQWKPNFAYTYIFKISDNTNGTTVTPEDPDDPDDPNPEDPDAGLFPITFDAVVISDEEDVQETITSVSDPSITTYAEGVVVTENNEYIDACDVYVTVMKGDKLQKLTVDGNNAAIFEVHNFGEIEQLVTEEVAANYLNNYCTLTPVSGVDFTVTTVPLTNGTNLTFNAGELVKFPAKAGKVYAFVFNDGTKDTYKIIRVKGEEATVAFTLTDASTVDITTVDGTHTLTLQQDGVEVFGAVPCFKITSDNGNSALKVAAGTGLGEYVVSVDAAAVAAGKANGTYTIDFEGKASVDITVNIEAVLTSNTLTIAAGASEDTELQINGVPAAGAEIVNPVAGLTVTDNGDGTYTVAADQYAVAGKFTNVTIGGLSLTIILNNYAFSPEALTITKPMSENATGKVALTNLRTGANGNIGAKRITVSGAGLTVANANASADGNYTLTGTKGGEYTLTFQNTAAKCVVTVNEYSIAAPAAIAKSTGIATIQVKCNGNVVNASKASLVETAKPTDAVYTLTTNGQSINFSNASIAGEYKFDYKIEDMVVAQVTVTVQ